MNGSEPTKSASPSQHNFLPWLWAALIIAAAGAAGSLFLSIGMGLKACPLCFYQRSFILAVGGVLAVGLLTEARRTNLLSALALPAAAAGFGIALFHVYLELTDKLECPGGVLGFGAAPQQSLAVFTLLLVVLIIPLLWPRGTSSLILPVAGLALGVLFALGAVKSSPPLPAPPEEPYKQPLEMCRPPYHPTALPPRQQGD